MDFEFILEEACEIAEAEEAVGEEAMEIALDTAKRHLLFYLRTKKLDYESIGHNYVASLVIDNLLKELNNA